jgi:hypothetical protein
MARTKDDKDEPGTDFTGQDENPGGLPDENPSDVPGGNPPPETIEKLAKRLGVSAPVFAAVKQMQGWASGKTVPEDEFKKAVEAFLGAPISGVKPLKGEHSNVT